MTAARAAMLLAGSLAVLTAPLPLAAQHAEGETLVRVARDGIVQTVPVSPGAPERVTPVPARVVATPQAQSDVNASISGQIEQVFILPGSHVRKGDPVATVTSPDFIFTQRSYLALLANDEQQDILSGEGNLLSYMSDARDNLSWWGMTGEQIDRLEETGEPVPVLSIVAPDDGVVTEVLMRPGEIIDAGDRTMQTFIVLGRPVARMIRDDAPLMLELSVYPSLSLASDPPPRVRIDPAGPLLPIEVLPPMVDAVTMQSRALVSLEGTGRNDLQLGQVLRVEIVRQGGEGFWIPTATLLSSDLSPTVFVEREPGTFVRAGVSILDRTPGWALVESGAFGAGDRLVARGKTMLEGAYRQTSAGAASAHDHQH